MSTDKEFFIRAVFYEKSKVYRTREEVFYFQAGLTADAALKNFLAARNNYNCFASADVYSCCEDYHKGRNPLLLWRTKHVLPGGERGNVSPGDAKTFDLTKEARP